MAVTGEHQLEPHDLMPHFDVLTTDGQRVRYADLWQHRNVVLVVLDLQHHQNAQQYVSNLEHSRDDFARADTTLVVTSAPLPGVRAPSVVVADRWGEIQHVATADPGSASTLPTAEELLAWVHFVRIQCPECPP